MNEEERQLGLFDSTPTTDKKPRKPRQKKNSPAVIPTYDWVEKFIDQAISNAPKLGVMIKSGTWGIELDKQQNYSIRSSGSRACCPMGLLLVGRRSPTDDFYKDAAEVLNVDPLWVTGFVEGFDGRDISHKQPNPTKKEAAAIYEAGRVAGSKYRSKLLKRK